MPDETAVEVALEHRIVELPSGKRYCVVGPDMGIDFHFSNTDPVWGPSAGLEMHYITRPSYLKDQEPFSENCWLTGGRCWGDGTSLYATEWLYPLAVHKRGSEVEIDWSVLEAEWHRRHRNAFVSLAKGVTP